MAADAAAYTEREPNTHGLRSFMNFFFHLVVLLSGLRILLNRLACNWLRRLARRGQYITVLT